MVSPVVSGPSIEPLPGETVDIAITPLAVTDLTATAAAPASVAAALVAVEPSPETALLGAPMAPLLPFAAAGSLPVTAPATTTAVFARRAAAASAPGESIEPAFGSASVHTTSPSLAIGITEANMESLAAAGFVSPGRPPAVAADAGRAETVVGEPPQFDETPPSDETSRSGEPPTSGDTTRADEMSSSGGTSRSDETPTSGVTATQPGSDAAGSAAIAAYWRWMHARLDAHLEATQADDLGAPASHPYRPLTLSWGSALDALEPLHSVGIRERAAFDARAFDGLRDGFTHLG